MVEVGVDADDLAHRPLPGVGIRALREPHPQRVAQVPLERSVVGLRGRDLGLVEQPAVDRQPLPVEGLDLVRDRDVGVQIRVAGAGVAVGERRGQQAADVDLADPVGALAGEQRLGLDEVQRVLDRRLVGALDDRGGPGVGHCPQRGDALHRREGEVVSGHGVGLGPGVLGDRGGELARVGRLAAVLGPEEVTPDLGANPCPLLRGDRPVARQPGGLVDGREALSDLDPEDADVVRVDLVRGTETSGSLVVGLGRGGDAGATDPQIQLLDPLVCEGVVAGAEQVLHVIGGDDVAGVQALDALHTGSDPHAGGLALLGVVAREPDVTLVSGVHRCDLAGQVVVPRSRSQLVEAHRHGHLRPIGASERSTSPQNVVCSFYSAYRECTRCVALGSSRKSGGTLRCAGDGWGVGFGSAGLDRWGSGFEGFWGSVIARGRGNAVGDCQSPCRHE